MAEEAQPLSDEERAELEALRAEKAEREERERAARERAELEALRAEQASAQAPQQTQTVQQPQQQRRNSASAQAAASRRMDDEDRRIQEARARGAQLMEPDDDLRMPVGQKIVLAVLAVVVAIVVGMTFLFG